MEKVVVVGAGVAGLTVAYELGCSGKDVLVIEKEPQVGGLARSFEYDGYIFDIGPHRFHTEFSDTLDFIYKILDRNYLTIERKSGVWMFEKYLEWPLRASSLFSMPLSVLYCIAADLLLKKTKSDGESFEDYIIHQYGKTINKVFFEPYTRKFLKLQSSDISKDWAIMGIDRAIIDKKIKLNDINELIKSLIFHPKPLTFIYPQNGGINVFSENLKRKIISNRGSVLVNSEIERIIVEGKEVKKVVVGGQSYDCNLLIWTGPVTTLLRLLGCEKIDLKFLSLLLYNYKIDHAPLVDYQWCYYGSENIPFNRVSIPTLFNPLLAPPGKSSICVEVTSVGNDAVWEKPETLEPVIRRSLKDVGLIKGWDYILGLNVERVLNAYPVYDLDYKRKRESAIETISKFTNIKLLGRTGSFWYNNMDHSVDAAIALSRELTSVS